MSKCALTVDRRSCLVLAVCCAIASAAAAAWENAGWAPLFEPGTEVHSLGVASDGENGTLITILDRSPTPRRAAITRLARTGTELWGDGGRFVEFDLNSDNQHEPVAIAPDEAGGAYVAWLDVYPFTNVLRLSRRGPDGSFAWVRSIADVGPQAGQVGVSLVQEPGVGVTVGWSDAATRRLHAARLDEDGTTLWTTDVNQFHHHNILIVPQGGYSGFDLRSDGQGGVLFAWYRYDPGEYENTGQYFEQIGVQRIDFAGNRLWGADGVMAWQQPGFWHVSAYHARVLGDGSGGAYVVTSGGSRAYGQHFDAGGAATWPAGGLELQAASPQAWDVDTEPEICADGVGGLILVHQGGVIFGQRVDTAGNLLWGPAGIQLTTAAGPSVAQRLPAIDADGFGGAVVAWAHWDDGFESTGGLRVDAFGTVSWSDPALFDGGYSHEIRDLRIVADGLGGAQVVWVWRDGVGADHVYALGVDGAGDPPAPSFLGIVPESGSPDEILPVVVLGDYLDDSYDYTLRRDAAAAPIGGVLALGSTAVSGWLDLTGAAFGDWDLVASAGGVDAAILGDAFGVGPATDCSDEIAIFSTYSGTAPFGSRRKAAYGAGGEVRLVDLVDWGTGTGRYLYLTRREEESWQRSLIDSFPGEVPTDAAFAIDALDRDVVALVFPGAQTRLELTTYDSGLPVPDRTFTYTSSDPLANPVVVVRPTGDLHCFVEVHGPAGRVIRELRFLAAGAFVEFDLTSGAEDANLPDADPTADGFALVYVRNSWLPGVRELCWQRLGAAGLEPPIVLGPGLVITSPSVAHDPTVGDYVACVVDNTGDGSAPTLFTVLVENGVPGVPRAHATDGPVSRAVVDGDGDGRFVLLTQETGQPMQIFLREADGRVLFPKVRLNVDDDTDWPVLAVQPGGPGIFAAWESYGPSATTSIWGMSCLTDAVSAVPATDPAAAVGTVAVHPNPSNPRTTLSFWVSREQWVRVEILDLRGRRVRLLHDGLLEAGIRSFQWKAEDDAGRPVASGAYFVRTQAALDPPALGRLTVLR